MNALHRTAEELRAGLEEIRQAPQDEGLIECIVIRPEVGERISLESVEVSPELGLHGDTWVKRVNSLSLPDGSPNPKAQIAIMNARAAQLIAQSKERWPLAGDNLFVDMDLSAENLQPGQRLSAGSAVLEITEIAHTGCGKFSERFGVEALKFVNDKTLKPLHLRGIYAQVIEAGTISVGDKLIKQ